MRFVIAALAALVVTIPVAAFAEDGDAKKGKKVFRKCRACHVADKEKNRVGPHLVGIIDRNTASVEGYAYSPAMMAKGAEGLVWTRENLITYLTKPKDFIPGTKMVFPGLKKDKDRLNLLAYLQSLTAAASE
ncbi:MAG: c-type cytochrome [Hyphomicrobiaceae bacterium]